MITGFNTDVKHNGKVYHVQTEDKGRKNPKIESLVYVGGEILDSYRTSYDQSKTELKEEEIMQLLESQHKRVIRTIKVGSYDEDTPFEEDFVSDRTFDEVVSTHLDSEAPEDQLKVVTNGVAGLVRKRQSRLVIQAKCVNANTPLPHTSIRVKLVMADGTVYQINNGETDDEGSWESEAMLPDHLNGDCEFVVQAISEIGAAEQRFPVSL